MKGTRGLQHAGIIDKDLHGSVCSDRGVSKILNTCFICYIYSLCNRSTSTASYLSNNSISRCVFDVSDHHLGTTLSKGNAEGATNAISTAGDDDCFLF